MNNDAEGALVDMPDASGSRREEGGGAVRSSGCGSNAGPDPREIWGGISLRCLATGRTLAGPQANPRCNLKSPTMGEDGGGRGCGTTRELQKLKQQALEYYRENDVPRRLEELLNSTFYLQPADVYGHLVGTWDEHPLPSSPPPPAQRCGNSVRLRRRPRTRAAAAGVPHGGRAERRP